MQIILNTDVLKQFDISIEESLTLLKIADKTIDYPLNESLLDKLQSKLFIKVIKEDNNVIYAIRDKGNEILKSLYGQRIKPRTKAKVETSEDFNSFITEYRSLWRGLKVGSMGSPEGVKEKLVRWMKSNSQYTKEDILRAAKMYINSLDNYKYLQQADFFIYKVTPHGETSRLSTFIDEKDTAVDDDWTNKLS